ncbi:MAG TPA: hypothetical protein VL981_11935 [Candidatus Methylacidiphilales bacterium]|nr:hypothetical protein [Candidatus Methylacidiphilales bacterium]
MNASVAIQFSIFVANKPGVLANVCDLLKKEKISIHAVTTSDNRDHSIIRLVVNEPRRALGLLEDYGTLVQQTDVIMVEGPNKPGTLGQISRQLAAAGINIDYLYCATAPAAKSGLLVFKPSDVAKALKVLNKRAPLELK